MAEQEARVMVDAKPVQHDLARLADPSRGGECRDIDILDGDKRKDPSEGPSF
jgi:hypothetical protein